MRRTAVVGTAVLAVLGVTGCAAGIRAETSRQRPTIDGIGTAVGTITVRNSYVGGPVEVGGSAPVLLSVFNNGPEPDRLVNVTSPEATGSTVPADLTLPPGGSQLLYSAERAPRLTGLTQPARVAEIVPLVLTFERAGEVRYEVPVQGVPEELLREPAAAAPPPAAPAPAAPAPAAPAPGTSAAPSASPGAASAAPSPSASPSVAP
jgi:copper(I)-binding protein